jgi:hypothetical protein
MNMTRPALTSTQPVSAPFTLARRSRLPDPVAWLAVVLVAVLHPVPFLVGVT